MSRSDTYDVLKEEIARAMTGMSTDRARKLAEKITFLINDHLSGRKSIPDSEAAAKLVPQEVRTMTMLTVGWDAFYQSSGRVTELATDSMTVICTLPPAYRNSKSTRKMSSNSGIWPGSLMRAIHELIQSSSSEIVIMAPYWSTQGVEELTRNITRDSMAGVTVIMLTQPRSNLTHDAVLAITQLKDWMENRQANVTLYCPKADSDPVPLLHAKAVVRDKLEAYVGSANFSLGGVEQSIELGVRISGSAVRGLREWIDTLIAYGEVW